MLFLINNRDIQPAAMPLLLHQLALGKVFRLCRFPHLLPKCTCREQVPLNMVELSSGKGSWNWEGWKQSYLSLLEGCWSGNSARFFSARVKAALPLIGRLRSSSHEPGHQQGKGCPIGVLGNQDAPGIGYCQLSSLPPHLSIKFLLAGWLACLQTAAGASFSCLQTKGRQVGRWPARGAGVVVHLSLKLGMPLVKQGWEGIKHLQVTSCVLCRGSE